jgi:outer membrane lipoprotein-sorting protein
MLLAKEKDKTKSQVIADVAFVPPDSKEYTIEQTNGSGLGGMNVRRMLASEAEVTKNYAATDLSPENYGFRFIREEDISGQRCYVLELLPRRKDKYLLRGKVWVDANTYLPRRFEGELAKDPSWWVHDVRVAFIYGQVGGMWLQTASVPTCLLNSAQMAFPGSAGMRRSVFPRRMKLKPRCPTIARVRASRSNPRSAES